VSNSHSIEQHITLTCKDGPINAIHYSLDDVPPDVRVHLHSGRPLIEHLVVVVRLSLDQLAIFDLRYGIAVINASEYLVLAVADLPLVQRPHPDANAYAFTTSATAVFGDAADCSHSIHIYLLYINWQPEINCIIEPNKVIARKPI
jgi:hypothetical protein